MPDSETKMLIEYLPYFLRNYYEFKQLCKSGDVEVKNIDKTVDWIFNSAFIADCDETIIAMYEKWLDITPKISETLEQRRNNVRLMWNSTASMTLPQLKIKLEKICGNGNYEITAAEELYNLVIFLDIQKVSEKTVDELLKIWLPMNIDYKLNAETKVNEELKVGIITKLEKRNEVSVEEYEEDATLIFLVDENNNLFLDGDGNLLLTV